ncbi:MAG TPA: efflux RND transporter periplasmic adaptor subunit [Candidatus Dormibacteraeota bacterium]|nr:efflux RND transporter periplasmic adaptor subunit [Candidatus Dormibacteraeota bacterium]
MAQFTEPAQPQRPAEAPSALTTGASDGATASPAAGKRRSIRLPALLLAVVLLAALAAALWVLYARGRIVAGIEASGTIEATQVDLAPKVSGRLERLAVQDGESVRKGTLVAQLDRNDPTLEVRSAEANLAVARARLPQAKAALALAQEQVAAGISQTEAGLDEARSRALQADQSLLIGTVTTSTQIDQARAQLLAAKAALLGAEQSVRSARGNARAADANEERARSDDERARQLVADGAIPAQQYDAAHAAYLSGQGQRETAHAQVATAESQVRAASQTVHAAQAALSAAQANRRSVDIARLNVRATRAQAAQSRAALSAAQAQLQVIAERRRDVQMARAAIDQAQAALALARLHLDETTLRAPFSGVVLTHEAEVGDLIGVGAPVVTIAELDTPYMWLYVPETDLARVTLGQSVDVTVDGLPGRIIHGRVSEISGQAEFTPSNVQTKEERVELVFGVKVRLPNPDGLLKPGLPADAVIRTDVPSSS